MIPAAAAGTHDRKHGTGDVDRPKQICLDLGSEVLGGKFLEEPGVEISGIVDEHVDAAEPLDGGGYGCLGVLGTRDLTISDTTFGLDAAMEGIGLAYVFEALALPHVRAKRLKRVLTAFSPTFPGFYLYYPNRQHQSTKLKALIDYVIRGARPRNS